MSTKKNIYFTLLALTAIMSVSCKKETPIAILNWDEKVYSNSMIGFYRTIDVMEFYQVDSGLSVRFADDYYGDQIYYADVTSTGYAKEVFDSLAIAHGDTSYNDSLRITYVGYPTTREIISGPWYNLYAMMYEVVHIDVITKGDWDENHPAGSSLNDIITFNGSTLKNYIQSGYPNKGNCSRNDMLTDVVKPLEDMTQADYELTTNSYNKFRYILKFDSLPPDSVQKRIKIVIQKTNETVDYEYTINKPGPFY